MTTEKCYFYLTFPDRYQYLDPLLPQLGEHLGTVNITVRRTSKSRSDEIEGIATLINGAYKIAVETLDLTPGLWTLQSIIKLGTFTYYGSKRTIRIPRWLDYE